MDKRPKEATETEKKNLYIFIRIQHVRQRPPTTTRIKPGLRYTMKTTIILCQKKKPNQKICFYISFQKDFYIQPSQLCIMAICSASLRRTYTSSE